MKSVLLLDRCNLKKLFGEIALKVIKNGCYYGYKVGNDTMISLQELPIKYSRSNFKLNGNPIIEFNVRFFDDCFTTTKKRMKVLKAFPKEFQQGYIKYKKGALEGEDTKNDG